MGSRKRKRKKKPGDSDFSKTKSYEEAGVHMPAFVAGIVTSVMVILLIWNQFSMSPPAKRALDSVGKEKSAEVLTSIEPKTFEDVLESGDADQLCKMLVSLKIAPKSSRGAVEEELVNRRRVDIANRLLTMTITQKQRELAVESLIDSLSTIYGMDFTLELSGPNVSETLRTAAEKYSHDENERIARKARLALLKHNAFERLKQSSRPHVNLIADRMVNLLKDYPEDEMTLSTVRLIVEYYLGQHPKEGIALIQRIQPGVRNLSSPKIISLVQRFSDRAKMHSLNYIADFENRWLNRSVGQKQLFNHSLQLLDDPNYGELIVETVDLVTQWFEQDNQYDRAIAIYQKMLESSESNINPEVAKSARMTAEYGLKRAKLLNQKIDFTGVSVQGLPLDQESFEKRVVVLVFWSYKDSKSIDALNQVYQETAAWRKQGGRLLAVSVDNEIDEGFKSFVTQMKDVYFAAADMERNGENLIWEQAPCESLPRAMLINRDGVVVDINVPIPEVQTEAGFLMTQ